MSMAPANRGEEWGLGQESDRVVKTAHFLLFSILGVKRDRGTEGLPLARRPKCVKCDEKRVRRGSVTQSRWERLTKQNSEWRVACLAGNAIN